MKKPLNSYRQRMRALPKVATWRQLLGGLVIAFSLAFLGGVLIHNWSELSSYEFRVDFVFVLLAFLVYSLALWVAVIGWIAIVHSTVPDYRGNKSLVKHLQYYVYSRLLQRLPIPLLYVFGRSQMYENEGVSRSVMVTISFIEWVLLLISGIVVCTLLLPFVRIPLPAGWQSPWLGAFLIGVGVLLLHPKVLRLVFRALGKEDEAAALPYTTILFGALAYGAVWILGGAVLFLVIQSLYPLSISHLPMVIGMWVASGVFTTAIFSVIPGFGSHEVTLTLLLGYIMQQGIAVIVMLLMRLYLFVFDLVWAATAVLLLLPLFRRITQKDYCV